MSIFLIIGVLLFSLTHLYPAIFITNREAVIGKIGLNPYKGIFTLFVLSALGMIIFGWRSSEALFSYSSPDWGPLALKGLMYPALFLFIAARANSNVKRLIRHPQLSAIALWGAAHLLANGDSRSLVLFGTLTVWALIQMFFLNRRDGTWQKRNPAPLSQDIIVGLIAFAVYLALFFGHGYFSGVALIP